MKIGQRIKAKDQEIYGKIVWLYPNEVVIEDEDAETEDDQLCIKLSEGEQIKEKWERNMTYYKYKIISKAIQLMVTWCCKNKDKDSQMTLVKTQGILNNFYEKHK